MSLWTSLFVFCSFYTVFGEDTFASNECEQFDGNVSACNNHQFSIAGYGTASCTYVALTTLVANSDDAEYVCLPDHCGLFANDETRCQLDSVCKWENDPTTPSSISRCFPACFNKMDIMFVVDGSTSMVRTLNSQGVTLFDSYLEEIQEYVGNSIPEDGIYNNLHKIRESFISFGGQQDSGDHIFPQSLTFSESSSYNQADTSNFALDLVAPGGNTNLRRALVEIANRFEIETNADSQRILILLSDGAATEPEILQFTFPELGINDFTDINSRVSLGLINCDQFFSALCMPIQYFDLQDAVFSPLDVYTYFFVLGEEIIDFYLNGVSNGLVFATSFVADNVSDITVVPEGDLSILNSGSFPLSRFSRTFDASICSRA